MNIAKKVEDFTLSPTIQVEQFEQDLFINEPYLNWFKMKSQNSISDS